MFYGSDAGSSPSVSTFQKRRVCVKISQIRRFSLCRTETDFRNRKQKSGFLRPFSGQVHTKSHTKFRGYDQAQWLQNRGIRAKPKIAEAAPACCGSARVHTNRHAASRYTGSSAHKNTGHGFIFASKARFIMERSRASSRSSAWKSAAFQFVSSVSGTASSHFCSNTASAILNAPSALTSPISV